MNIDFPEKSQIPMLRNLLKEAFEDTDTFLNDFFTAAFGVDRCMCATLKGEVIAALYWFDCAVNGQKIAYVYAVATKKEQRGKGVCTALMEATHRVLKENGYYGAILVPSGKKLFEFYEKFGYKTSCFNKTISDSSANETVDLTQIDAEEFAFLRKKHLPENSVVAGKETLALLAKTAKFFKGENLLFSAEIRENTLYCDEIFGNTELASKIIKTLNCEKGVFKTVGDETPFAMFLKLKGNAITPTYFAFAFD